MYRNNPWQPLTEANFNLGPWAGQTLKVSTTKTGTRWHGYEACSAVKSAMTRSMEFQQPQAGTMADIVLPDSYCCDPPGDLANYRAAVVKLIRFDNQTAEASTGLSDDQRLKLDIVQRYGGAAPDANGVATLEPSLDLVSQRRHDIVAALRKEAKSRLPLMLAAIWIQRGRTPREHQPRFRAFTRAAEQELKCRGLVAGYNVYDQVTSWLEDVAAGMSCKAATNEFVAEQEERQARFRGPDSVEPDLVGQAWRSAADRWTDILRGVDLSHDGYVIVLHSGFLPTDWNTQSALGNLTTGAFVSFGNATWHVQTLPVVIGKLLEDKDRQDINTIVGPPGYRFYSPDHFGLLLKNLLITFGLHDHTDRIQLIEDGHIDVEALVRDERRQLPKLPDELHHQRLDKEQIAKAYAATARGITLPIPRTSPAEPSTPRRKPKARRNPS